MNGRTQEYVLENVRIRGRFLTFRCTTPNCPLEPPIALPFGTVLNPKGCKFVARTSSGKLSQLVAVPEMAERSATAIRILPPYAKNEKIRVRSMGRDVEFTVWQVRSDVDRMRATQIISRTHYLSAPPHGLILGCEFTDPADQKEARLLASKDRRHRNPWSEDYDKRDPWSEAWNEKPGGMIACAVLDTLYHGNPLGRQRIVLEEEAPELLKNWDLNKPLSAQDPALQTKAPELFKDWNAKGHRKHLIEKFHIAWASRFAIDAPYQDLGIGRLLAKYLAVVAGQRRIPQASYVEVITTVPSEQVSEFLREDEQNQPKPHDFLLEAGYTRVGGARPSRPLLRAKPQTGDEVRKTSTKKFYYYAKSNQTS